jgi:tetratricopeptide (TPR) repeat protein
MNPHLRPACFSFLLIGLLSAPSPLIAELAAGLQQNAPNTSTSNQSLRELRHQDPSWDLVKLHLPDPATATREQLETVGDVLRARRFPEDALDFYLYALKRGGGNQVMLLNKIGVTHLELRHTAAARSYFQAATKMQKKDPVAWNNLGAVEYMDGRFGNAISDYNRAIKLNKTSAIYHSNLATALFEQKRYKDARDQFRIALQLDPDMAHHDGTGGLTAHMLSPEDHARYCFEMARLYAELGDETNMLRYLTMASEGGFDVMSEMRSDPKMDHYRKDTRVLMLVQNAKALRSGRASIGDSSVPPLPPVQPN